MKKIIAALLGLTLALSAFAQAQLTTKKAKISDLSAKTMKVVLTGNDFQDAAIKDAVKIAWTLSPFVFCSQAEFEAGKVDPNFYYLAFVKSKCRKETAPGVAFFTLVKGTKGAKTIDDMLEVSSVPVCSADFSSSKEATFMTALLDLLQKCAEKALVGSRAGLNGLIVKSPRISGIQLILDREDLSAHIDHKYISENFDEGVVLDEDGTQSEEAMTLGDENTAVAYLIAPSHPEKGAACYVMLIDAQSHELYYFTKHSIGAGEKACISKGDISNFLSLRK